VSTELAEIGEGSNNIFAGGIAEVGRCRLTASKPVFKVPMVSALKATI
jgi:hypothetical protein